MDYKKFLSDQNWRKELKFAKTDTQYLQDRRKFSKKYGHREIWDVMDHWPLYCGIKNLSRYLTIVEYLKETLEVPGHIAEFGSWRGSVIVLMAKILRIIDPHGSKMIHCFESFEGMVKGDTKYSGSYNELQDILHLYRMDNEVIIHKGQIEKTLPKLLKRDKSLSLSFVYYDLGSYDIAKLTLENIHPRLSKNALVLFDEWNFSNVEEETIAVNEFLRNHPNEYETFHIKGVHQPSLGIRKTSHY